MGFPAVSVRVAVDAVALVKFAAKRSPKLSNMRSSGSENPIDSII